MNPKFAILGLLTVAVAILVAVVLYLDGTPEASPAPPAKQSEVARPASASDGDSSEDFGAPATTGGRPPAAPAARTASNGSPAGAATMGALEMKLAGITDPFAREAMINEYFRSLAGLTPDEALAQVRNLPDRAMQDTALLALLGAWSGMTTAEMLQNGEVRRFGVAGALGLYLMNSGRYSPMQTAALANEFLSGGERTGVLSRAAENLAARNPAEALKLGEGLTGWEQARFLTRFASGWASTAPQAARQWAAQIGDPSTRRRVLDRILETELATSPASAANSFLAMPPEQAEARARAADRIAAAWARRDTEAAIRWAQNLTDPADRAAAQRGVASAAPVGIGARLSNGNDGVPVLQDLVPGSPASSSGQLRPGDRVLAVSDGRGGWVDSRGLPVGQVSSLIRGAPNTQVSIQVQSPGESAPRTVTLGRQQIIFRQ